MNWIVFILGCLGFVYSLFTDTIDDIKILVRVTRLGILILSVFMIMKASGLL